MPRRASLPVLLVLMSACASSQGRAASTECRTFASGGKETIDVGRPYEGYFVVGFEAKDGPSAKALTVFAARESADGGADVRRTYARADLPAELPRGTVRGYQFSLAGERASADFRVTLALTADGCRPPPASAKK
jgi:hypothetical protein